MIDYNSAKWRTLLSIRGSVFPRAARFGVLSGVLGFFLKYQELHLDDVMRVGELEFLTQSAGFSLFSATLAFVLVFRTSQAYSRFWHCATSVSTMRAQMVEAASSLCVFSRMSKAPPGEVRIFRHKIVRLMSLLHGLCLGVLSDRDKRYSFIDLESFKEEDLKVMELLQGKERVDVAYIWINALIIHSLASGLLNVPPPILSRVFQELEKSMVEFHQVMQVMDIPFPFPYAQMAVVLLLIMAATTPLAMCYWTGHPVSTALFSAVAIVCLTSLELIAEELDNPFGEDDNDLPCEQFQAQINASLYLLTTKVVDSCPELSEEAVGCLEESIARKNSMNSLCGKVERATDHIVSPLPAAMLVSVVAKSQDKENLQVVPQVRPPSQPSRFFCWPVFF